MWNNYRKPRPTKTGAYRLAVNNDVPIIPVFITMEDSEYDTLLEEFDTMIKQMDLIGEISGIEKVEPMSYPFPLDDVCLREDSVVDELEIEGILKNSGSTLYNQVKLPKVVE